MNEYVETMNQEEEGISLQDLFKVIWSNKILIIFVTAWVVVLGIVYTFVVVTPKYTANASVMIQVSVGEEVQSEQQALYIADRIRGTYQDFIVSRKVLTSVIEDVPELEQSSLGSLKNSISLSSPTDALIIYLYIENESPELAEKLLNQLIVNSIDIANNAEGGVSDYIYLKDRLVVLDEAILPTSPSSPNKALNVVISFILGGIIALGVVFVKEFFNNKFKTKEELEKYLNIRVLASVPGTVKEKKGCGIMEFFEYKNVVIETPNSLEAEAYRKLELNIRMQSIDQKIKVIQTTSPTPRDGKTTTAINLAAVYAEIGKKTLIVDFDLRRPKIHRAFNKANDLGFYNFIVDDKPVEEIILKDESGIDIIVSGKRIASPHIVLQSKKVKNLMEKLRTMYDVIIVDSPPILSVTDPFSISEFVDGVLYVVAYNQTKKEDAKAGLDQLQDTEANVLGSVFANVDPKVAGTNYEYYYRFEE